MHTIVLATQKGGSGKSTLAIGLAVATMGDGHRLALIETDQQGDGFELGSAPHSSRASYRPRRQQ